MNDEEFKRKLEAILENLYRIDREVESYITAKRSHQGIKDYRKSVENEKPTGDGKYKT